MRLVLRILLCVALAAAAAVSVAGVAAAASKPKPLVPVRGPLKAKIGIADQKPDVFADQRFRRLGLRLARRSVPWDLMDHDWQVEEVDAWLRAARRAGVTPVITFARSRIDSRRHVVPTTAQIRKAFLAFRARWPWVTQFAASNESNHYGEPTGRRPKLAAEWYRAMRRACPRCKIAAATLVDYPNLVRWTREFLRHAKERPKYWALHAYLSGNRFDDTRTKMFLRATTGEVWITEVGGAIRRTRAQATFPEGPRHAADVTRYVLDGLARVSPRITRVFFYHWNAAPGATTWDSGFIDANGKARPAYTVLRDWLKGKRDGSGLAKLRRKLAAAKRARTSASG